ncbi:CCA tRNA nucleotidyltransferase [Weissella ceti]|uniref:CCA-adding enzyme n=1 Tax=Weissella ceti TaxID=759620 RepID=A0ABT3E3I5_9LACO|nr:CCA tRNA nucleotidyltransferase [Weissella ceti]MCW0952973.1 CCA tRNA nucleotidyltransferase [Weissella ceti]QVK11516.1 CCA tRNA nucleotidyltransferase [Weissella ceti]
MQIKNLPAEFEAALPILATIEAGGYEAYFVGGSVRDTLLGKPIHDVDIATSAYPDEVKALFDRTVDTGIEHGTVMILDHGQGYETTTFRTESTYTDYRRPDEVTFVRSLEEDLKRRDFTVNALAMKADGTIIDLFDGLSDLDNGILRAVGDANERFNEDALRMVRAVRFAAQLGFKIEESTLVAVHDNAELMTHIAVERTNVEFTKLMQGKAAEYALLEMITTGLFKSMPALGGSELDLVAFAKLLEKNQPQNDEVAWTLLCFELGLSDEEASVFLRTWKHSKDMMNEVRTSLALLYTLSYGEASNFDLYKAGSAIKTALAVAELSELNADTDVLQARYDALVIKNKSELKMTGRELTVDFGLKPGPLFGRLINDLEAAVVAGKLENTSEALMAAVQKAIDNENEKN